MKRHVTTRLVGALVLALTAASCGGGSEVVNVTEIANAAAKDVRPPSAVDIKRTGLPGLVIATNSPSMRRLARAPDGTGAVILFVEPGGPSDGLGVGRGDLITEIGGEKVTNHSRALALLHDRPGKEIEVKITHRDGRDRTITIKPREPLVASLRQYLNPLVDASPRDPVLRFVRAQTPGLLETRLNDLEAALDIDKRFVEALTLRASLIWDNRPAGDKEGRRFVTEALDGWKKALAADPRNATALTTRATVLSVIGNARQSLQDASKAIEIDASHPRAYYAKGVAEEALRRPDRAAGPARAAVELDPFNIQHWRLLARIFTTLKRKDDCRRTAAGFTAFLQARNFQEDAATLRSLCR
ncbi:MAG TPA: PDZ domain-containing protein [Actinomycetota bacterium]|jgi:Tfp pilus assembly protein PilF|nr:PDZ domain-containing protein [Actinomycetota bacterium]